MQRVLFDPCDCARTGTMRGIVPKNRILLGLAAAIVLWVAFVLYRSYLSGNRVNVEPNAAKEIEKAKRR